MAARTAPVNSGLPAAAPALVGQRRFVRLVLPEIEGRGGPEEVYMPLEGIYTTPLGYFTHFIPGGTLDNFYIAPPKVLFDLKKSISDYLDIETDSTYSAFREAYAVFKRSLTLTDYFVVNKEYINLYIFNLRKCIQDVKAGNYIYRPGQKVSAHFRIYRKCIILHDLINCMIRKYLEEMEVAQAMVAQAAMA
jgi:hypothetical protein